MPSSPRPDVSIALAQINSRIGDFAGNSAQIRDAVDAAVAQVDDASRLLVVTPELALCGYPPRDLLYDRDFVREALAANQTLASDLHRRHPTGPGVLCGTLLPAPIEAVGQPHHPGLYDAAVLMRGGTLRAHAEKRLLPVYDVFYEPRWFVPGPLGEPIDWAGHRLGVLICEDLWDDDYPIHPANALRSAGADVLICLSASPYRLGVLAQRRAHARRAAALGVPVIYVNAVGAQDELIFDGGSFAIDTRGLPALQLPRFCEAVRICPLDALVDPPEPIEPPEPLDSRDPAPPAIDMAPEEELLQALTLGVRDFCRKNGVRRAFVGLSGGIDSALVLCIAVRALGADAVTALMLPSRFNDPRSSEQAQVLCHRLRVASEQVSIEPLLLACETQLRPLLGHADDPGKSSDTTIENLQARLRALVLMAYVNRRGGILLNTSNKTELAVGYSTLYGDMAGALGVIADLTKPQVYALCRHINATQRGADGEGPIPAFILDRPPSAELRPDQVDPFDYPRESPIIEALAQQQPVPADAPAIDVARYRRMLRSAEHKRWQFGIALKVSEHAFGTGRMIPVTRAR